MIKTNAAAGARPCLAARLVCLIACLTACGSALPAVSEVPVQNTSDWRVPKEEWDLLHQELLHCRRSLERLGVRYAAQRDATAAYNTVGALLAVGGTSAAISGVLDAAGVENEDVNKALGITGAVLGATGPLLFGILSGLQSPSELRAGYEKTRAAYTAALRGRAAVLYCQTLLFRTPEAAVLGQSDDPEILADRARFQEICSPYYTPTPSRTEPVPSGQPDEASRRRSARRIIDPEHQLTRLTEQLRQGCAEDLTQTQSLRTATTTSQQGDAK